VSEAEICFFLSSFCLLAAQLEPLRNSFSFGATLFAQNEEAQTKLRRNLAALLARKKHNRRRKGEKIYPRKRRKEKRKRQHIKSARRVQSIICQLLFSFLLSASKIQ